MQQVDTLIEFIMPIVRHIGGMKIALKTQFAQRLISMFKVIQGEHEVEINGRTLDPPRMAMPKPPINA